VAERRPAGDQCQAEPAEPEQETPSRRVGRGHIARPIADHDECRPEHQQPGDDRGDEAPGERDDERGRAAGRREQHEERSGTHG
jgi:hypothetical protein